MSASTDSVALVESGARLDVTIENLSSSTLYIRRSAAASPADHDYVVEPGGTLILDAAPVQALQGAWDAADGSALVTEVVESAGSVWRVGGTPMRASFAEMPDVAQFENAFFRDYPASPGLAVAGGLAEPFAGGTGWAVYIPRLGAFCEGWIEIGRLPTSGDMSLGILDDLYGATTEGTAETLAAYISIGPDGQCGLLPQGNPEIDLPAGTFELGDRVGLAQVATGVIQLWRNRGGVLETLVETDPGVRKESGWIWFGGADASDMDRCGVSAFGCGNVYPP